MNEQEKKSWAEMSLEEKKDTFGNYIVYEVTMAMKGQYAPFLEKVETFDRAYNGLNGVPYNGLNSLVLDLKQKQGNYQSNVWLSLAEAKQLKVDEKEIDSIFQDNSIPKAKISFIKAFEYIPVYELDENGNKIPLLDKDGNQRLDKHTQEPLFRYVYEPQLDKDGNLKINLQTNQPYIQMKTEKVAIKPTLESKFLYNVDVFKTLDKNKMKPIKKEFLHKVMLWHKKDFDHSKSHLIFGDIENKLHKATAEQIKGYLIAQNNDVAYEPPMKLNETQKQEVERIIDEKLKENAPNNAWIYDDAIVLNGAKIFDNAKAFLEIPENLKFKASCESILCHFRDNKTDKNNIPIKYIIFVKEYEQPFNSDKAFNDELLYILGLEEETIEGKITITSSNTQGSLLDGIVQNLGLKRKRDFEDIFSLLITWNNRIIFLRLLESMLLSFKHLSRPFLNIETIPDFKMLDILFFDVLAKKEEERKEIPQIFQSIPYLNSSLFDKTDLEKDENDGGRNKQIKFLESKSLVLHKNSILKKESEYKNISSLPFLEYLFAFLKAYDFTTTPKDIKNHTKANFDKPTLGIPYTESYIKLKGRRTDNINDKILIRDESGKPFTYEQPVYEDKESHIVQKPLFKTPKEELKNLQEKENTLKTETEKIQIEPKQEIKSIDTPANQTQEIMENTPAKTFVLPFPNTHFKSTLKKNINEFIKQAQESSENNQKLLELNIIKDIDLSGNSPKVFSREAILPQEKINDFTKDYAKSYLKTLSNEIGVGMEFLGFNVKGDILLSSKINLSQTDFSEMIKSKQINSNDLGFH